MNKGYTLVELLGVVIILILLTALVLPNVINSIKGSSKNNDDLMEDIIISAAKIYMSDNFQDMHVDNGFTYCIPLTKLVENDYLKTPIKYNNIDDITGIKAVKITYINSYSYSIVDKAVCSYIVYQTPNSDNFLNTTLLKSDIEEISIVNSINIPNNSLGTFDISDSNNGTIILWYTDTDSNDKFEVYIGSNQTVVANSNSTRLFSDLTSVVTINLNYLDTSKIIDASNMFFNTPKLTEINMSNCNFNNVKSTDNMFKNTKNGITVKINDDSRILITNSLTNSEVQNSNIIIVN